VDALVSAGRPAKYDGVSVDLTTLVEARRVKRTGRWDVQRALTSAGHCQVPRGTVKFRGARPGHGDTERRFERKRADQNH
jgi:hypothetical protein